MQKALKATNVVLILLCAMYFITYIVRQNISTAIIEIRPEFNLSNTQAGLIFSAFGYPYLLFQIIGGQAADRFGPRLTLLVSGLVWAGATVLTSVAWDFYSLFVARVLMGFGVGCTLPTATRAMQYWVETRNRGYAQGITHAFSRLGNAVTPFLIVTLMALITWRGSFIVIGLAGFVWVLVWYWYFRNDPYEHPSITKEELAVLPARVVIKRPAIPWGPLVSRIWPVTLTYFCYGWCLWLYLSFLLIFFKDKFGLSTGETALFATIVYTIGAVGNTIGGVVSDKVLHNTNNVRTARIGTAVFGFVGALLSLMPILYLEDKVLVAVCLSSGFFFAEMIIGPMWAIPMDIAPKFSGTASGLMNSGSALAAILSPVVAGIVTDATGDPQIPFVIAIGVLMVGAMSAFLMHPERQLTDDAPPASKPRVAPAE
ncbi:MAG: MFS transporter [Alphaproteobacteria bacterium]|nr:MFS transporter [Alphaproteobacteria bacterium]